MQSVAIVGGGPAASMLAAYLSRAAVPTVIISDDKRPELIVGESLVPAIIPFLQELGVEDEVASYSTFKGGATFYMRPEEENTFQFVPRGSARGTPQFANYAYNVPRDRFDATLRSAAERAGARVLHRRAAFLADGTNGEVTLDAETLDAATETLGQIPEFFVDATGRSRALAKLFSIPFWQGVRRDTALFAHVDRTEIRHEGFIHVDRLKRGWSWRIPLPGRVSVGVVAPSEYFEEFGDTAEAQYDSLLATEQILSKRVAGCRRLSRVMKYNNWQLVSDRFYGPNWAMAGDAAGFIDPIFSSGLLLGLSEARDLAEALQGRSSLATYASATRSRFNAWRKVIECFYAGELFALVRMARAYEHTFAGRFLVPHVQRRFVGILSGRTAESPYNQTMLAMLQRRLPSRSVERLRVR